MTDEDTLKLDTVVAIIDLGLHFTENTLVRDRKSTRLNSHGYISYAVFCLKKKKKEIMALL